MSIRCLCRSLTLTVLALLAVSAASSASGATVGMDARTVSAIADSPGFATLRQILAADGHQLLMLEEVSEETLKGVDGFILLQTDEPPPTALVDTLIDFVKDQGNLLVIADPQADGEFTLVLNALAGKFGITYASSPAEIEGGRIARKELPETHPLLRGVDSDIIIDTHRPFARDGGKDVAVKHKETPSDHVFMSFVKGLNGNGHAIFVTSPGVVGAGNDGIENESLARAILSLLTAPHPVITRPVGILAALALVLSIIFWIGETGPGKRIFGIIPKLVFCYFVPTTLTTFGILPEESVLYGWIKMYMLPASLLLLILALDVPGIIRLGPRAVIMLLAGTTGVVIGGPLALLICKSFVPPDTWQGMTALCGSWIGGGANMVALGDIAGVSSDMFSMMVIVDVFVANIWMGVLLYLSGQKNRIDKWTGADTSAIEDLQRRIADFQARTSRIPTLTDLIVICAFGFVGAWVCYVAGNVLGEVAPFFGATTWKFILITSIGVAMSFTPARRLEGAGASKIGSVFLYLLVASIGAHANFLKITQAPGLIAMGFIWMSVHIIILLAVGKLIRAPIFFVAVGSQANIGGAASAPIVASAFHPTLAPVGVLLAVAGYVLGTYAGLLCMALLKLVAGA